MATIPDGPPPGGPLADMLAQIAQLFGPAAARPISTRQVIPPAAEGIAGKEIQMAKWNEALRSVAIAMIEGDDITTRITGIASAFKVDVHTTTIAVEEMAEQLR